MRTRIPIHPATFNVPERTEASARATELGQGLVMELHSTMTYYFADPEVELGKIAVYAPRVYKGLPQYVKTLNGPDDHFDPWAERTNER